jgi:hypothetical protein
MLINYDDFFLAEPYEINTGRASELEDPFGNGQETNYYSKKPELSKRSSSSSQGA